MKVDKEFMDNLFAEKERAYKACRAIEKIIEGYQTLCEHEWGPDGAFMGDYFYKCKICQAEKRE